MAFGITRRRLAAGAFSLLLIVLVGGALLRTPAVLAHAAFVGGTPNDGDVLSAAPVQIDAFFAEDIVKQSGTYGLAVYDANGNQVDNQDTVLDDFNRRHMTLTLQSGLSSGSYRVHWWTVSDEDGDAASGDYSFSVVGS
jgi:methionine-rich copper-binding protein CopC